MNHAHGPELITMIALGDRVTIRNRDGSTFTGLAGYRVDGTLVVRNGAGHRLVTPGNVVAVAAGV